MLGSISRTTCSAPTSLSATSAAKLASAGVLIVALVPHAMQYGPQASIIAENFPTNLRYTGAGLGYQLSSIIAGGPAALVATYLLHEFGTGYAVAVYMLVAALITIAATFGLKDYSKSDISSADTYTPREAERVAQ